MEETAGKNYKIKGTLQVSYKNEEATFSLYPDAAYISPDKKSAVFYQDAAEGAKQLKLEANKISFDNAVLEVLAKSLTQLALQNKPVELHLDESCETITGFTYPAR